MVAMEASSEVESLYASVYQEDGSESFLVDRVVQGDRGSIGNSTLGAYVQDDLEKEKLLNRMLISQLLGTLSEEEKRLITLRYFENKTQVEIARLFGISQVQVSRLEKKILRRMRDTAGEA